MKNLLYKAHSFVRGSDFSARKAIVFSLLSLGVLGSGVKAQQVARPDRSSSVKHVIHISVDALGGKYLEKFLQESPAEFPTFVQLIREGAATMNARTDYSHTITLPNHTSMLTGRPVFTPTDWRESYGHYWQENTEFPGPKVPASLHATNPQGPGSYTASAFDVAHDAGLKTALYAGKAKFRVYTASFGAELGAPHARGRNKIDSALIANDVFAPAMADLKLFQPNYAFLHFAEPDSVGHAFGYLGAEYRNAVKKVDGQLGELLTFLKTDAAWKNRSVVILSADHGGQPETQGHGDASHPFNYTIPFFVWGTGVKPGADLYALNAATRTNPGEGRPVYAPTNQPIRNGDGGNLALRMLGLPAIPGSHINVRQNLAVR
jgi:hypothetical protein